MTVWGGPSVICCPPPGPTYYLRTYGVGVVGLANPAYLASAASPASPASPFCTGETLSTLYKEGACVSRLHREEDSLLFIKRRESLLDREEASPSFIKKR